MSWPGAGEAVRSRRNRVANNLVREKEVVVFIGFVVVVEGSGAIW